MLCTFNVQSILAYGSYHNDVTLKLSCRYLSDQKHFTFLSMQQNVMSYVNLVKFGILADETKPYRLKCLHHLLHVLFPSQSFSSAASLQLSKRSRAVTRKRQ